MPTVKAKSISQHKMRRFLELQLAAKELEKLKSELKEMIKAKAPQQPGRYQVSISVSAGSRRPPWKDEYIKVMTSCHQSMGEDEDVAKQSAERDAENIIKKTKPGGASHSVQIIDTEAL